MQKTKVKLKINTAKDIEETNLRLKLNDPANNDLKIKMLIAFRPNASLRQIHNVAKTL